MQCGPCPVAAVKQGLCNMNYDVGFVFAEVNGDRVFWEQGADGKWFKTKVETAAYVRIFIWASSRENLSSGFATK